ncbi:xylulokinase [Phormidesmis sp. 146-33]
MLLGIDLGTGSVKALLMTIDGTPIAQSSHPYLVNAPHPGWAETNPEDWWSAVAIAVRKAVQNRGNQIQAIGLSGQMHGVVLSDANSQPLYPAILWADTRASEQLYRYHAILDLQNRLANPITTGMAGTSLLWLQKHEFALYTIARWAFQPKDWLRFRLTGTATAEPSDASGTLLFDLLSDRWSTSVLDRLNLRSDWLPPLIASHNIAGYLTPAAAASLNLPIGLPVISGAADTAAALLGSGLLDPGIVQLTIGTAAQIATLRSEPIPHPHYHTHLYRSALPDQWYALAALQNAGLALEWVRNLLSMSWSEVYAEAFTVSPGCQGLTFLPYLTGERTPHLDPHARGSWVGLGLHHTRSHLMRAALEGVAFSLRQGLNALRETGITPTSLRLAGGGTIEPAWKQLLADILQLPLHPVTVTAASVRGAAILAGLRTGTYTFATVPKMVVALEEILPKPPNSELEAAWHRYESLYPSLRDWRLENH